MIDNYLQRKISALASSKRWGGFYYFLAQTILAADSENQERLIAAFGQEIRDLPDMEPRPLMEVLEDSGFLEDVPDLIL